MITGIAYTYTNSIINLQFISDNSNNPIVTLDLEKGNKYAVSYLTKFISYVEENTIPAEKVEALSGKLIDIQEVNTLKSSFGFIRCGNIQPDTAQAISVGGGGSNGYTMNSGWGGNSLPRPDDESNMKELTIEEIKQFPSFEPISQDTTSNKAKFISLDKFPDKDILLIFNTSTDITKCIFEVVRLSGLRGVTKII